MSWYYVGPDAKPVGPISLEELQLRRSAGAVAPETYIIEAPPGSAPREWKRYRDFFPAPAATTGLPPVPAIPAQPGTPTIGIPHPLFPSAPPVAPSPGGPVFTGTHPSAYHLPSGSGNTWCAWGFGLGLASLPFLLCVGLGAFMAVAGLVCCIVGLVQIRHTRQDGRGLAIAGMVLCVISLLVTLSVGAAMMAGPLRKAVEATTEQTSNDSDTR